MNISLTYNFEKKAIAGVVETTDANSKFEIVYDVDVNTLRLNGSGLGEVSYSNLPVLRDDINFTFTVVDEIVWLISQFCMVAADELKDPRGQVCWFVIGKRSNNRVINAFTHAVIDCIKQKASKEPTYKWDYTTGRLKEVE